MNQTVHSVFPAGLHDQYRAQLTSLANSQILSRLWAKDMSLWSAVPRSAGEPSGGLQWLDLPGRLEILLNRVSKFFTSSAIEDFDNILFVGVHAAGLAGELLTSLPLTVPVPGKRVLLLNSLDPEAIRGVESQVDLARTLFFVATKQDTTLRVHLLLLHFLKRFKDARIASPGSHFIVFTEETSHIAHLAKTYSFREVFIDPPGIPAQFSGLIHYGTLLTSLSACTPAEVAAAAREMARDCSPRVAPDQNPALLLTALLLVLSASSGRLLFLAEPRLAPLADRLAFLVSSTSCRQSRGIVALRLSEPLPQHAPGDLFAILSFTEEPSTASQAASSQLRRANLPLLEVNLPVLAAIPSLVFCWEIATCLAASFIGADPFSEPDLQDLHAAVHSELEIDSQPALPRRSTPRIGDSSVELYFEGATRRELSTLSLELAAKTFFRLIPAQGYLLLLDFLPASAELRQSLSALQLRLQRALGFPVLLGAGARWVHRIGQMVLAGPPNGAILLVTADSPADIPVPGADYTFGQVRGAYASALYFAVTQRERFIVRAHLRGDLFASIDRLASILLSASAQSAGSASSSA